MTDPPGSTSSITAYGARALARTIAAATTARQFRNACVRRSRPLFAPLEIDMEFAEVIAVSRIALRQQRQLQYQYRNSGGRHGQKPLTNPRDENAVVHVCVPVD